MREPCPKICKQRFNFPSSLTFCPSPSLSLHMSTLVLKNSYDTSMSSQKKKIVTIESILLAGLVFQLSPVDTLCGCNQPAVPIYASALRFTLFSAPCLLKYRSSGPNLGNGHNMKAYPYPAHAVIHLTCR